MCCCVRVCSVLFGWVMFFDVMFCSVFCLVLFDVLSLSSFGGVLLFAPFVVVWCFVLLCLYCCVCTCDLCPIVLVRCGEMLCFAVLHGEVL